MNTQEINSLLSNYECFIGTYPRDVLPKNRIQSKPCAIIINTDESTKPGQHWVALFLRKDGVAEFFDSFGLSYIHEDILKFLKRNKIKNLIYNSKQLQSVTTSTCGAYCILFVKYRCSGLSFCDVINYFSNNRLNNDMKAFVSLLL